MDGADRHTPLSGFFFFVLYMNVGRWDIYLGGTGWDRQRTMEALDDDIGDFGCRRLKVMMKEGRTCRIVEGGRESKPWMKNFDVRTEQETTLPSWKWWLETL